MKKFRCLLGGRIGNPIRAPPEFLKARMGRAGFPSLCVFLQRFNQKADRPEPVVAGNHGGFLILHPTVVKIPAPVGQRHYKGRHTFPCAFAHPFRALPAVGNKNLPLPQVAGVRNGVFIPGSQLRVEGLFHYGNSALFHPFPLSRSGDRKIPADVGRNRGMMESKFFSFDSIIPHRGQECNKGSLPKGKQKKTCGMENPCRTFYSLIRPYYLPKNSSRSSSTVPMPAMPKFSIRTFATLGDRNAGRVGPR